MSFRVLIADDSLFMRSFLKNILKKYEFEVCGEAADGNEAVEKYKELRPDIVTLDMTMPNKDGLTAAEEIRGFDLTARVVMCTGINTEKMANQAKAIGVKAFLVKPFKEELVAEALKLAMA